MKHFIGVTLLILVLTAIVGLGLSAAQLLPQVASLQGEFIDQLFQFHIWAIAFLFSLIVGFMLYSIFVFRRKAGDESDAPHVEGNNALEVTWTILPLIAVVGVAVYGADILAKVTAMDPQALEIKVIGQQWAWRFEYPDYGIVSEELVLPVDKQVLLVMESADVLHSFWVPEFRVKQDLMPGSETELRITPTEVGSYRVRCAEVCGLQHAYMLANVSVLTQSNFDAWLTEKAIVSEDPVERGQDYYIQYGCQACHSLDGSQIVGPSFVGAYGRTVLLEDGTTTLADETYLYQSIINPNFQIVSGYPANAMPQNFGETMTDEQIADLIEFIKSLSDN
ncbi:MAG: cytochrome c oxidase subunit II [Anaerolineales bacterium]|nr:cytochrome c oxidase subunit II [Anaerolineales bacterium]